MKANEFVKKFGWDKVKSIVLDFNYNSSNKFIVNLNDDSAISIYDLKRIIESHDYIESLGGYQFVKENLQFGYFGDGDYKDLIQKCLEDVESCQ